MLHVLLPLFLALSFQERALEIRKPGPAPAHEAFQSVSAAGLRFVWWLPEGYDGERPRNLSVILHGTGLDYRWGLWNNPPGTFRPLDVVVSVDGTSPGQGDSRLFLGEEKDADAFAAFLAEMRKSFSVDRIYLYGHSQGGFFVTFYAGLHPDTVAGVVAHASGLWSWTETGKRARGVATAFLHGTGDPVVPYRQSPAAWAHLRDQGWEKILLRRMPDYNHWPNALRATECLDWCEGMTTDDPDRALALTAELLRPKGLDAHGYDIPPAFAAARMVLRRLSGEGPDPLGGVPSTLQERAAELASAIEKRAAEVAEDLAKETGKKFELTAEPPIAALLAYREDFRGVDAAERWIQKSGFAKAEQAAAKASGAILEAWYAERMPDGERFTTIVGALEDGWLWDGYPPELAERLAEWQQQSKSLGLDKKALKAYEERVEPWRKGWEAGVRDRYFRSFASWKVPK